MMYLMAVAGLALLLGGGELLVRGAVGLARVFGVSALVIGLTVVAFGTSAPELVVCLQAALGEHPGIVLGNVVGSNVANILLIVGLAALLRPIAIAADVVRREGTILLAVSAAFVVACLTGELSRALGAVMVAALAGFTWWSFRAARHRTRAVAREFRRAAEEEAPASTRLGVVFSALGIAGVIVGAHLLIEGSVEIARAVGLSEAVIGLTLVAVGTSLPELATSGMAAVRGHSDLAVGNAVGSNLFNILGIAGVTAVVVPVPVPDEVIGFDLWVMMAVAVAVVVIMAANGHIGRLAGAALVASYVAYIALLVTGAAPSLV
jgi:cation:H+ antiporter